MKIEQLMKRPVRTCQSEDSLDHAAQLMWEADCGCVPVVDGDGRLLAMITDRDICMAAHFQGGPLRALKVKNAMSKSKGVFAGKPYDKIADAESIMRSNQVRRLPVVDEENRVVGIVSLNDIAAEASAEAGTKKREVRLNEVGRTLGDICRHRGNGLVAAA
jgi:CBS domain-containing protein